MPEAPTLLTLSAALRLLLGDPETLRYTPDALDLCLSLALDLYNRRLGTACTVEGLDGASATTLPAAHAHLIALGGAFHALALPPAGETGGLNVLPPFAAAFEDGLRLASLTGMRAAADPPYAVWQDGY